MFEIVRLYWRLMKRAMTPIVLTLLLACLTLSRAVAAEKTENKTKHPYPLKTCVVSDEKLGEMGDPFVIKYQGREVQLCCKNCQKDFKKDPAKYIKKLDEAEKKQATK
jgi:YHS domain-containing protein